MSTKHEVEESENAQTQEQPQEQTPTATNPLDLLTEAQRKAIGNRFNKSWLLPRQSKVEALIRAHSFDFFTAAFTLSLQEDADNLISARKVASVADRMVVLAGELFGTEPNREAALLQIETAFDTLDAIQQPAAGKRFRKLINAQYTSKMGARILEMCTKKLEVREAEWC